MALHDADKRQYNKKSTFTSASQPTRCICPKCGGEHLVPMNWTGRGMPKKYCNKCLLILSRRGTELIDNVVHLNFSQ